MHSSGVAFETDMLTNLPLRPKSCSPGELFLHFLRGNGTNMRGR